MEKDIEKDFLRKLAYKLKDVFCGKVNGNTMII